MDVESEKMHLQSLEEYVLDEGKIVTYRWLSKVLNIHVNLSKELLSKFAFDPVQKTTVYLTYLISGKLKDGTYCVLVTDQDKFDDAKSDFEQITSHHVYSVQKKKEAPSESLLYMVNSEKVENEVDVSKQISSIKCAESIQRAANEISTLRLQLSKSEQPSTSTVPVKKPPTINESCTESAKKETEKNVETSDKSSNKKPKMAPGGIAAMFAAQNTKPSKPSPSNSQTKAKPLAKKTGGINSFFNKVPKSENQSMDTVSEDSTIKADVDVSMDVDLPTKEVTVKDEPEERVKETKTTVKETTVEESKPTVEAAKATPPTPAQDSDKGKASSSKINGKSSKKKNKSKTVTKKEKPRKRIKVMDSDSSDDDIFGEERESSPEPDSRATPPPSRKIEDSDDEIIPPTPQPQPESDRKNCRKRKVVKDKSYVDDDGYIVTEKVTVYENCSDEETEEKVKKPKDETGTDRDKENNKTVVAKDVKKPAKKTASPVKNKQASLMSFFKRV